MNYRAELLEAIEYWNKDPIEDELFFDKFRKHIINPMSQEDAYRMIGITTKVLIEQSDESTCIELIVTIINLAYHSDTTEVPPELFEMKDLLVEKFKNMNMYTRNKLNELFKYYRMTQPFE